VIPIGRRRETLRAPLAASTETAQHAGFLLGGARSAMFSPSTFLFAGRARGRDRRLSVLVGLVLLYVFSPLALTTSSSR
jgi:hypothetical protein